jgi:lysophospholipase L1-like esterase
MKSHVVKILRRLFLILCAVILALLFIESALRVFIRKSYYEDFYQSVTQRLSSQTFSLQSTLFCIGDSTMFGIGASDNESSLPSLLQRFSDESKAGFSVVNLGYPGTNTEQHLRLLSHLPAGARILLRSGANNQWNQPDYYTVKIFGIMIQSRLLKVLFSVFPDWLPEKSGQNQAYIESLNSLCVRKKFKLLSLDYCIPGAAFKEKPLAGDKKTLFIWKKFQDSGLTSKDGRLLSKYRWDLLHPNDLGYYLESILVWNEVCKRKWFELTEKQVRPLKLPDSMKEALLQDYSSLKIKLIKAKPSYEQRSVLGNLQNKAELLFILTGDPFWKQSVEDWKKIRLYIFHDKQVAIRILDILNPGQDVHLDFMPDRSKELLSAFFCYFLFYKQQDSSKYNFYREMLLKKEILENISGEPGILSHFDSPVPVEFCEQKLQSAGMLSDSFDVGAEYARQYGKMLNKADFLRGLEQCSHN